MIELLWIIITLLFVMNFLTLAALARINLLEDKVDRYHHEEYFESFYTQNKELKDD